LISGETDELWDRNLAAGVTKAEMYVSQLIVNTCALVLLHSVIAILGFIILDIPIPAGNEIFLALLIILTVLSAQYLGFFVSTLFKTYVEVNNLTIFIFVASCFGCGKKTFQNLSSN
jgi:hypothetical protein